MSSSSTIGKFSNPVHLVSTSLLSIMISNRFELLNGCSRVDSTPLLLAIALQSSAKGRDVRLSDHNASEEKAMELDQDQRCNPNAGKVRQTIV